MFFNMGLLGFIHPYVFCVSGQFVDGRWSQREGTILGVGGC